MNKIHDIKIHPSVMLPLLQEIKTFEYRFNDRDYQVGDILTMFPFDPDNQNFKSLGFITRKVTYIIHGPAFGIPEGYCIMSIVKP